MREAQDHATSVRDSAVRRLTLSTRWMVAGSVVLTGVLSEVAAQAFPGKTLKTAGSHARVGRAAVHQGAASSRSAASPLAAPSQTPNAAPEHSSETQSTPEYAGTTPSHTEATPSHAEATPEHHSEAAPERQATPRSEAHSKPHSEATPAQHSEAAREVHSEAARESSAPAQTEAPVVSGGS